MVKSSLSGETSSLISMISIPTLLDVGAPNQQALNEHTNGLLRKDGLGKDMDLSILSSDYVHQVSLK